MSSSSENEEELRAEEEDDLPPLIRIKDEEGENLPNVDEEEALPQPTKIKGVEKERPINEEEEEDMNPLTFQEEYIHDGAQLSKELNEGIKEDIRRSEPGKGRQSKELTGNH
jgi:hypothetical protein